MLDKHYDHAAVESGKYEKWVKAGYFTAGQDKSKPVFSLVIPPPNVTGKLHLGHVMDTVPDDIVARYKRMKGYDVLWVPGMDHAGIATQAKVEEKLRKEGISRYDLGREGFLKEVWKWKEEYAKTIHEQWAKLGLSVDYTRERFTLDEGLSNAVKHVFVTLYNEGLIYQGERIINWDPELRTALSNIEVIHKDDEGEFFYFSYDVADSDKKVTVATTRPETMFGDTAVFVNPKDKRYRDLVGKKVINPANGQLLPLMADSYVDMSFGTGAMKCTPAHDPNDFALAKKYGFPLIKVLDETAHMMKLRIYSNGTPNAIDAAKGDDTYKETPMVKGEKGVWSVKVDGDLNGKYYTYVVTNAYFADKEVVDPYAKAVGVDGKRGEILDLSTTNPEDWDSVKTNVIDRKALTVWECHIADLTSSATWTGTEANRKRYAGFHESGTRYTMGATTVKTGFDHVKELGVNAVQILPMFDQDNDEVNPSFNWGYNPLNYNAPEGVYSSNPYDGAVRIKELKALIADYTKAGINIIMDVVYNHVASAQASNFQALVPGYYFRYNAAGNFSNGSGCGNETASEHYMMRKFIVDSASYWAKEYKLGGFRFDLMGIHDLETMNAVEASCKAILPSICIYGEPWAGGDVALDGSLLAKQANGNSYVGYGQFNDGMRDALIKSGMNDVSNKGWVSDMDYAHKSDLKNIVEGLRGTTDSATVIADPDKTVNYAACHDNYTLYDRIVLAVGRYDARWTKQMCTLANSVVFTSQGTTFMLAGDEFARTKGMNGNSYNSSYKVNELDYGLKITNASMFASYQKLIALKQKTDGLHLDKAAATNLSIETSGDNEIVFTLKDTANGKTYKVVHANGYGTPAAVNFEGYTSLYLDTLNKNVSLSASTPIANYQTLIAVK